MAYCEIKLACLWKTWYCRDKYHRKDNRKKLIFIFRAKFEQNDINEA